MPKLPRVSGKEVVRRLRQHGFVVMRVKGSHHFMQHADGLATVVPVHGNEVIGPGLLNKILSDCELTVEEFEDP